MNRNVVDLRSELKDYVEMIFFVFSENKSQIKLLTGNLVLLCKYTN